MRPLGRISSHQPIFFDHKRRASLRRKEVKLLGLTAKGWHQPLKVGAVGIVPLDIIVRSTSAGKRSSSGVSGGGRQRIAPVSSPGRSPHPGSLATPDGPISGILIAITADAAYRVHALGVRVVAAALRPGRPVLGAPWILPKPLGGDRRSGGRRRGDGHCRHDHGHVDSHVPPRVSGQPLPSKLEPEEPRRNWTLVTPYHDVVT